jgi:hypothetical protein
LNNNESSKDKTIGRIQGISRFITILSVIVMAVAVILIVGCVALGIWAAVDMSAFLAEMEITVTAGDVWAIMLNVALVSVSLFVLGYLVHRVFHDMEKSHTPFKPEYARDIKLISYVLLINAALSMVTEVLISIANEQSMHIGLTAPVLVSAVIVYFLSLVFAHGAELQRTSDELL